MTSLSWQNQMVLTRLRQRWAGLALVWLLAVLLVYGGLTVTWSDYVNRWLGLTAVASIYCLWVTWQGLVHNHRDGEEELLATLGWGNRLTLLRGLAISMVAGFLFSPWPQGWLAWLPMALYTVADVADYLDGYLARVTNHATGLGARLDMEFDGLGMLVVSLLAVWYGQLPWWYLLLGLARYLFLLGAWRRRRRGLPVHDLPPSVHRRLFAGFQMGFMSAVLWPILPPAAATIAGTVFALPTALGFLRDWLVASGRLDPASARYHFVRRRLVVAMTRWLPPLLRLLVLACMVVIVTAVPHWWPVPAWVDLFVSWHLPAPALVALLFSGLAVGATAMVALGAMGRFMAFTLVFPLGFDMVTRGLLWPNGVGLAAVIALMLLGTGPFSLWRPEDRYLLQRLG